MIKKGFKIAAVACMAACLVTGLFLFNNGSSKADGESTDVVVYDFSFEDGDTHSGEFMNNGIDLQIDDSRNSTAGEEYDETISGNSCLRVDRSKITGGWWHWQTLCFDLKKLQAGVTYKISMDVMHENDATTTSKGTYDDKRAIKIGTLYDISDTLDTQYKNDDDAKQAEADAINEPIDERNRAREERNANLKPGETPEPYEEREIYRSPHTRRYGQIGPVKGPQKGDWERLEGYITVKEDVFERNENYFLYLFFAYPESGATATTHGDNSDYSDSAVKSEIFYIDNFRVIDVSTNAVPATPTPVPTAVPFPETESSPVPQQPIADTPVVPDNGPSLEKGYEEAVKGITYRVLADNGDTVSVVGFDDPKSKLVIPATVTFEGDTFAYKVVKIEAKAFKGETDVKSLTIGANVTEIGKSAFDGCTSLKKINVKKATGIKKIGKNAFKKVPKKAVATASKKNKKAYAKLFKKAGFKGKVK